MTIAILCSGQGRQHPDMFGLTADLPDAQPLFAHAATLLGGDPRERVRTASADALRENRTAQLLCTLQALAAMTRLGALLPPARCVAGYSVGEIAAWSVAGFVDPVAALDLVAARADAMNAASGGGEAMLFVRGAARDTVSAWCAGRDAALAIANPGDGYVLAGTRAALDEIAILAERGGASRVAPVCVNVASHTPRLAAAVPAFRAALAAAPIGRRLPAGTRLLSGIDGAPVLELDAGLDKLARQIAEPVEWAACIAGCVEAGARAFIELGPGHALAEMAAAAWPDLPARSLADFRSWDGVEKWLVRVGAA